MQIVIDSRESSSKQTHPSKKQLYEMSIAIKRERTTHFFSTVLVVSRRVDIVD